MDSVSINSLTSSQKDQLMDQIKDQVAIANVQELLTVRLYKYTYFLLFMNLR